MNLRQPIPQWESIDMKHAIPLTLLTALLLAPLAASLQGFEMA